MAKVELTAKQKIEQWLPHGRNALELMHMHNEFNQYFFDEDGANYDGHYMLLARTLQALGEYMEDKIKERRYDMHIGMMGVDAKAMQDGVLFEVVAPGRDKKAEWEVNVDYIKENLSQSKYPELYTMGKFKKGRKGYCKVTIS